MSYMYTVRKTFIEKNCSISDLKETIRIFENTLPKTSLALSKIITVAKTEEEKREGKRKFCYVDDECVCCLDDKATMGMACGHVCLCKGCAMLNSFCTKCRFEPPT